MKHLLILLIPLGWILAGAGCAHIDVSGSGDPERVLNGTVTVPAALPAGAELLVRLVDVSGFESAATPARNDLPLGDRGRPTPAPRILGEDRQSLTATMSEPVPFRIEYRADDSVLRHGLNIEVRVSFGGRVRYRTINAHVVTLASSPFPQVVNVEALP
jgi:uncharacterized lipoprotein YbaY